MHKNILTVVGITILFLGLSITSSVAINTPIKPISNGNTLYVGGTGEGNYTKIQDAINNASDGDTVFVYNGTYYENVIINKNNHILTGEDKNTTIIDGGKRNGNVVTIYYVDWVAISGFTIKNSEYLSEGNGI